MTCPRFPQFQAAVGTLATLCITAFSAVRAAEPDVTAADMPRVPATAPDKAAATFTMRPGIRAELVAAEPLVVDPIALAFDAAGRAYVVEMRDYSERRPEQLGRIRLLEDTDRDGRMDKSTVFLEGLPWPTAVTCYDDGVFVGVTPEILYAKDTDGDGKADIREVVFTGFASDFAPYATNKLNVQAMFNSFQWALDNRIHGASSYSAGRVRLVDSEFTRSWRQRGGLSGPAGATETDLRGRDFSFDPRTLEFRTENGGAQHGMSFDDEGRKYVCSNSDHLQLIAYAERYGGHNRFHNLPAARVSIAADGPAAEVYRTSPEEPWRVIRTKWRVSGIVPGLVEGGGRSSGYFTGATGATIYRGDALGADFVDDAFIADAGSNLIHRKKLRPDGVLLRAERAADEQTSEFLASRDNWFRPVQFANAPDGGLWVVDMYREYIEHPWSIPSNLKRLLDLNSGNDRGRLWRIVGAGHRHDPARTRLQAGTTADLVATLEHPNGWHRDTASRLLYERQDRSAVPRLRELFRKSKSPLGRVHALRALEGLGGLESEDVKAALADTSAAVRRHALQLAELPRIRSAVEQFPASLWLQLAADPDPATRFQLALTLGQLGLPQRPALLARIGRTGAPDSWLTHAVVGTIDQSDELPLWNLLASTTAELDDNRRFLAELADEIGARNAAGVVPEIIRSLAEMGSPTSIHLAAALSDGLERAGRPLQQAGASADVSRLLEIASRLLDTPESSGSSKADALRLLARLPFPEVRDRFARQLFNPTTGAEVKRPIVQALGRYPEKDAAVLLATHVRGLPGNIASEATQLLMRRKSGVEALLDGLEGNQLSATNLTVSQVATLRNHADASIRDRSLKLFGPPPADRGDVINRFLPALSATGNADRGRETYRKLCASCHRAAGEGHPLGPDLESVKSQGKEKLLVNILDPNREVPPNYFAWTLETRDNESISGLLARDSASDVTLRQAGGIETTVARTRIGTLRTEQRSLMPEGLEAGLQVQDLADLLVFLTR